MSSWIEDVRKSYGNGPMIIAGTGVLIWRIHSYGNLEVLLQKRKDVGKYGLFGGAFELGENGIECAVREVSEEAGLVVPEKALHQLRTYVGPEHHTIYPNGQEVYHLVVLYSVEYSEEYGVINPNYVSEETRCIRWVNLKDLRRMIQENPEEKFFQNNIPILWDVAYRFFE